MLLKFVLLQAIAVYSSMRMMLVIKRKTEIGHMQTEEFALCLLIGGVIASVLTPYVHIQMYMLCLVVFSASIFLKKQRRVFNKGRQLNYRKEQVKQSMIPLPLIIDGTIQQEGLNELKQTELWLRQQLRSFGYRDIRKISYCSIKGKHSFFIDSL
ncbi:YetF domain-containing protein [Shouchella patagoniensis]|uniref:YetF domain-containing protein n=1 Tax=Shouchella patagoniensis TaxID=228576 RepID=UPI000994CAD0|nr:YetF domain-containing protein [Shouchella patagoniensis]